MKLVSFFLLGSQLIFSQWYWQNPLPQGNPIRDIIATDENIFVAGGLRNFFLNSSNSGISWDLSFPFVDHAYPFPFPYGISFSLGLKYFSSENILYGFTGGIVSQGNTILYRSTDRGLNWDSLSAFGNWYISDIDKNSENSLFAVGSFGKIYRSTNSGQNWELIPSGTSEFLQSISFFGEDNGCIVGREGVILRTSDNGNNWSTIPSGTTENLFSLDFGDHLNGIIVGYWDYSLQENTILATTDAGLTWNKKIISNPLGILLDVEFIDPLNIIIVGGDDDWFGGNTPIVFRSSNGGESWTNLSEQFSTGINSVSFYNPNTGICGGNDGSMYKSTDSGNHWTKLSSGELISFYDICTFDTSSFYACGYGIVGSSLLFTENGGSDWGIKNSPINDPYGIDFVDKNHGVINSSSSVYYTLDGCNTWHQGSAPTSSGFKDVEMINTSKAFLTAGQVLLKSTNSGNTWLAISSGTTGFLENIVFKDSLNGLIIANEGPSIITTDGGETWSPINHTFKWLKDGCFFGDNSIGLGGSSGNIYISTDGGFSWNEKTAADSNTYISDISFEDALHGTAVGESGLILTTSNGGNTWTEHFSPTLNDLVKIEYADNLNGIIIGENGLILGTHAGQIVDVELQRNYLPYRIFITQNYPNPFNPSTTISYSIPEYSEVTIRIFDILGKEIETLVDEERPAGSYQVNWNAANLPSGVYFYQLKTGNFVDTKKMILMK